MDIVEVPIIAISDGDAILSVFDYSHVLGFKPVRFFFINSAKITKRGGHSHKECAQLISITKGTARVTIKTPLQERIWIANSLNTALYIPPGHWVEIEMNIDTTVTVLADKSFSEEDYIRDFDTYCYWHANSEGQNARN